MIVTWARLRLASPSAGQGHVRQIPFSDWLNAQTGNLVAFQARDSSKPFAPLGNLGVVDYAGVRARDLGLSFGFSVTGTVSLRELPDGTGEVLVSVGFTNVLTRVSNSGGALILGYIFNELPGHPSRVPGLSNGHLQAKYIVPDPASPELDLAIVTFAGGGTLTQLKLNSEGEGPLRAAFGVPEGTPGKCILANTGVFNTRGGGATADGYPAERVDVRVADGADLDAVNASPTSSNASGSIRRHAVMNSGQQASDAVGATGSAISGSWGQLKARYCDQKASQ